MRKKRIISSILIIAMFIATFSQSAFASDNTSVQSQKASTLNICDKIIVLDKFKIIDFDTPQNLSKKSKLYQELIRKQERSS